MIGCRDRSSAKKSEKQSMAIAMESIWPIERMVATMPDAKPRCCLSTELMIAFVFGEEKSAYPRPSQSSVPKMMTSDVSGARNVKTVSPTVMIAIPAVATTRVYRRNGYSQRPPPLPRFEHRRYNCNRCGKEHCAAYTLHKSCGKQDQVELCQREEE